MQASLVAGWLASTGTGLSAALNPTSATLVQMGPLWATVMGAGVAIASLVAAYGIIVNEYRLEWVAAWVAAAAFVPYVVTVWSLTVLMNASWLTAAFITTTALAFFVSRALLCAAHAAKLRVVHVEGETITTVLAIVEGDGDVRGGTTAR